MGWLIEEIGSFVIGVVLTFIWQNKRDLTLWFHTTLGKARDRQIRFSIAYLFKIKIDGKYLLVRNTKISNQFQPIGGVYKTFDSFNTISNELEVTEEKKANFRVPNDLRVYVKSKNAIKFVKWFQTRQNREVNVTREFFEEIIDKQILGIESLKDIEFEFVKTYDSGLHYAEPFSSYEILLHDIFEVRLTQDIKDKLKQYVNSSPDNYLILVEQNDIQKKAVTIDNIDYKIGEQTSNIL